MMIGFEFKVSRINFRPGSCLQTESDSSSRAMEPGEQSVRMARYVLLDLIVLYNRRFLEKLLVTHVLHHL